MDFLLAPIWAQHHVSPRQALAAFLDRVGTPSSLCSHLVLQGFVPHTPWSAPAARHLAKPPPLRSPIPSLPKQVCWLRLCHFPLWRAAMQLLPPAQVGCAPTLTAPRGQQGGTGCQSTASSFPRAGATPSPLPEDTQNFCSWLLLEQR